jgi:hypothetical protein
MPFKKAWYLITLIPISISGYTMTSHETELSRQWFEHLSASPMTVVIAGLFTLIFAVILRSMNTAMKEIIA